MLGAGKELMKAGKGLLNQYSPVPRARSLTAGKDAGARASTGLCRLRKVKGNSLLLNKRWDETKNFPPKDAYFASPV